MSTPGSIGRVDTEPDYFARRGPDRPLEVGAVPRYELHTVVHEIVGRKAELAGVERFVVALPEGPSALVIQGESGIGKTTLWSAALGELEAHDYRALTARPAESEAMLSYVALADLVGSVFDEVEARLPPLQARTLATVLLRRGSHQRADPRTTAAGLVSVLTALAADRPLVVAVDDVHWLDRASAHALEFAARRLPTQAGLLLTGRSDGLEQTPLNLDRALPEDRLLRIVPTPLSLGALHHLIESRLGTAPPRPKLIRILEASGGNPFFALEIARALPPGDDNHGFVDPLPVPSSLQELVASRLPELPPSARELVLIASALPRLTLAKLDAMGFAVWRFSSSPHTATVPQPVDYEQTAYCLVDRESWNNFNSTLGELEHDLRFCIEVWPASQLNAP